MCSRSLLQPDLPGPCFLFPWAGNYLEYESLTCWAGRAQPTPKHVLYGATELLRWAGRLSPYFPLPHPLLCHV